MKRSPVGMSGLMDDGSGKKCFVPHRQCSVASGDCFRVGHCLDSCRIREKADLSKRMRMLEERCAQIEARLTRLERKP